MSSLLISKEKEAFLHNTPLLFLFFSHFLNCISCDCKMSVFPTTFMAAEHCALCLVVCGGPHGGLGDLQRMIDEDLSE